MGMLCLGYMFSLAMDKSVVRKPRLSQAHANHFGSAVGICIELPLASLNEGFVTIRHRRGR